ncbi:MAG: hypothetical protein AB1458_09505 [Bacteroidota bacterium]
MKCALTGFLFFVFLHSPAYSQNDLLPLNRDFLSAYDKFFNSPNSTVHTSIRPYLRTEIGGYADSARNFLMVPAWRKKLGADTARDKKNAKLGVDALFSLEPGYSLSNGETKLVAEAGFSSHFDWKDKLSLNFIFLAGNSSFPGHRDSAIKYTDVVPGMGPAHTSKRGYAYQYLSAYLSYSPNKVFNFQLGQDKNFLGDGYRSLFLSDQAAAYPFLKLSAKVWKIKYMSLFALHADATAPTRLKEDYKKKFATIHYLSWNATKRLNISFFEAIVWQGPDSNRYRGFDVNYLNPVIFFRPVEYSLGSSDNAFLGFGFKAKLPLKSQLYGQLILDEFYLKEIKARKGWWANKQGFQLGLRLFDLFRIKNLEARGEFNYVRPYTYSHGSIQQNYGHMNQPLAHPLGANFMEGIGQLGYRYNNWFFEGKLIVALYGADSAGTNMGHDIFQSYTTRPYEYGHYTTQGMQYTLSVASVKIAYLVFPDINLQASVGVWSRSETPELSTLDKTLTNFVFFSLSTALWNTQNDY